MTTELARYDGATELAVTTDPTGGRLVSWAYAMGAAKQLADALCNTTFVPQVFRNKPDDGAAAIMYGDEIGFTPGQSLQNIYVISGKPSLYARAMVALVLSHGHEIWTEASSPQRVIVCGKRRGSQHVERIEWTRSKAEQAGYTSNKKYMTDPESMLYARASGDVARRIAPDALAGIAYTVEELELADGATLTATTTREPSKRTAQRANAKAQPEPDLDPETGGGAQAADAQDDHAPSDGITSAQSKHMHALFNDRGMTDRDDRLAYTRLAIGRADLTSSKELSKGEASAVIDVLLADTVQEAEPDAAAVAEPNFDDPQETTP